jgi:5,10-methylenetetrahydromethanopterin reductase
MTVSVLFGQQVDRLATMEPYADLCARRERRLWMGQSVMLDTHAALAALAGRGYALEVGLGVAVAPLRSSLDAAVQARSLASLMGRPVAAGYGIGSVGMAARFLGGELKAPATYTASYVEQVKEYLRPEEGSLGRLYPLERVPEIEVGCGVLRPRMAQRAARVSDFVITWLTPRQYLKDTLFTRLADGAAEAGRKPPRVVSVLHCAVARGNRNPVRLAALGCSAHLAQPHYSDMLVHAGLTMTGDRASDLREALRSGLFCYGSAEEIAEEVLRYLRDGVDEVVLNVSAIGLEHGEKAAAGDLEEILDAVDARRTR